MFFFFYNGYIYIYLVHVAWMFELLAFGQPVKLCLDSHFFNKFNYIFKS